MLKYCPWKWNANFGWTRTKQFIQYVRCHNTKVIWATYLVCCCSVAQGQWLQLTLSEYLGLYDWYGSRLNSFCWYEYYCPKANHNLLNVHLPRISKNGYAIYEQNTICTENEVLKTFLLNWDHSCFTKRKCY